MLLSQQNKFTQNISTNISVHNYHNSKVKTNCIIESFRNDLNFTSTLLSKEYRLLTEPNQTKIGI